MNKVLTEEERLYASQVQEQFDKEYITANEIAERLEVERSSILYRRRQGFLPNAITVRGVKAFIWRRAELEPYLKAWHMLLKARRGERIC